MRRIALATALVALALPAGARAAEPTADILVMREPAAAAADIRERVDAERVRALPGLRTEVLRVPAAERDRILALLNRRPDVRAAEPNFRVHAMGPPLDGQQWGLARVRASSAWNLTTGAGVTVAVVDGGINFAHEDLPAARIAPGGRDWIDDDALPADDDGHGTHVSAIVAGDLDNQGTTGVAPSARVLPLRALDNNAGSLADVAAAFAYGADRARIVNASLSSFQSSAILDEAIRAHPNTLFVVAAGNEGVDNDLRATYPCNSLQRNLICVGATDEGDARAVFSNVGRRSVDVFAPGTNILSAWLPGSAWRTQSGTSMATPHVAGVAALVLARNPSLSAIELKNAVLNGVQRLAGLAPLSVTGGRIDAVAAVTVAPPDTDRDGIGDAWDVCAAAADADQPDADADGIGDACDDGDGDGVVDARDACPSESAPRSRDGCRATIDFDGDGILDVVDRCPTLRGIAFFDGCPDTRDRDLDGRVDSQDACPRQRARTRTGCPKPRIRSVKVREALCGGKRCLKVRIALAKTANLKVSLQRCRARCRTLADKRRRGRSVSVTFNVKLGAGRRRIVVLAHNAQGRDRAAARTASSASSASSARIRLA